MIFVGGEKRRFLVHSLALSLVIDDREGVVVSFDLGCQADFVDFTRKIAICSVEPHFVPASGIHTTIENIGGLRRPVVAANCWQALVMIHLTDLPAALMIFLTYLCTATSSCLDLFETCQTLGTSFNYWARLMMLFHSVNSQRIARVATVATLSLCKSTFLSLGLASYCLVPSVSRINCGYSRAIVLTISMLNVIIMFVVTKPRGHDLIVLGHQV